MTVDRDTSADSTAVDRSSRVGAIRAGIVGTGFMGLVHARAVSGAGGRVVAIVGSRPGAGESLASRIVGARSVDTFEELLHQDLDVVHVCTPNALHLPMARAVLRAGLHVVCEKPLATTVSDAAELVALAAERRLVATVPFVYRYYPTVRLARERIAREQGNPLWLLHGSYLQDWMGSQADHNWRADPAAGGASRAFGDIGVHWCDLMEFVTGQRITKVQARFANAFDKRGPEDRRTPVHTEDGVAMVFETDRGAVGCLAVSQATAGRKNRLWFSFDGPNASYVFDQECPETLWVGGRTHNEEIFRDPNLISAAAAGNAALPAGHPEGYAKNFENFVVETYRSIAGQITDGLPTFSDGLRAATVTAAAVQSARTREWVDVASMR
jgi:predicted dehydrogenase